jgi:predicted ATPase
MLKSLKIQHFKRFKELTFPSFKRVNLLAGKNNTGKTGVLEALLLLIKSNQPGLLPSTFRNSTNLGSSVENYWKWQFLNRELDVPIRLSTATEEFSEYSILLAARDQNPPPGFRVRGGVDNFLVYMGATRLDQAVPNGNLGLEVAAFPARPTEPQKDATDYDRVVLKSGGEERLENLLRKIEPRLKSIRSIKPYGASLLYVDVGLPEKIPAVHLGQGFIRLLSIYSELIAGNMQVLLIDEVENGLHHSVLIDLWRGLQHLAETENVQVFATTHSYECIRAAHQAFAETLNYDFALHRLEEVKGEVTVTTYDKETLENSLQSHFEMR